MELSGERIGHYRVLGELTGESTGSLYLAERRSGERVVLKVLPSTPLGDADLKQRVVRETGAACRFEHPRVVQNLGVEEAEGRTVLVFEDWEAKPLARRLAQGPATEQEVLALGLDVVEALDAAHQYGLLHCDVHPGNIFVDPDGRARLIGLGLGKTADKFRRAAEISGPDLYLAPEQVSGGACDERTDLFSLGAVLYHGLTGHPPFPAADREIYRESVLGEKPAPPSERVPGLSKETDALLIKALQRDPKLRFQYASEMRAAIEAALEKVGWEVPVRAAGEMERLPSLLSERRWWYVLGGALVVLLVVAVVGRRVLGPSRAGVGPAAPVRLTQITDWPGTETDPSISPEGDRVVFASNAGGNWDLWLGEIESGSVFQLTDTPEAERHPSWSPDGNQIVYSLGGGPGGIRVIPVSGGESWEISSIGYRPAWSPSATSVVFDAWTRVEKSRLWLVGGEGGLPVQLTDAEDPEEAHVRPRWSPDGREVIFERSNARYRNIWAVMAESKVQRSVTRPPQQDFDAVFDPLGRWVYFCSGVGDSVHIYRTIPAGGRRERMTARAGHYSDLSISTDGRRLVFSTVERLSGLWRVHVADGRVERIETDITRALLPRYSPDGSKIALSSDDEGSWGIYVLEGNRLTRASPLGSDETEPRWSPDGKCLAFVARTLLGSEIRMTCPEGAGVSTLATGGENFDPCWSPDGSRIAYVKIGNGREGDVWVVDVITGEQTVVSRAGMNSSPRWSPDGSRVLFHSVGEAWSGLYLATAAGGVLPSFIAEGSDGTWSPDGRWIACSSGPVGSESIQILDVQAASTEEITGAGGFSDPSFSPDGRYIAFLGDRNGRADLWVVPARGDRPPFRLVEDTNLTDAPVWSPDGEWLFFTSEELSGGDLWMYENL